MLLKSWLRYDWLWKFCVAKAIPQMADTKDVVGRLETADTKTKLLAIIANLRGAEEASAYDRFITSVFLSRSLKRFRKGIQLIHRRVALGRDEEVKISVWKTGKELVIYISMAFGNPYGDPYDEEIVFEWVNRMIGMDIGIISLADTVGLATAEQVFDMTSYLVGVLPGTEIGVHLHFNGDQLERKARRGGQSRLHARFDGALKRIGRVPMANDELVGNMNTEWMINYVWRQSCIAGVEQGSIGEMPPPGLEIFVAD